MKTSYYFVIILLLLATNGFAQTKKPPVSGRQALLNYIEELKRDNELKNASWGLMVVNPANQQTVASYRPSANMVPASILKLVTTGVGALNLGENYRYTTQLAYTGTITPDSVLLGDVYIIGGGDPSFGSKEFANTLPDSVFSCFYTELKNIGIAGINGRIIADASLFDEMGINGTWEWADMGTYYGAGTSALSFAENTFTIPLWANDTVNGKARLGSPNPYLPNTTFHNKINTVPQKSLRSLEVLASPFSMEYTLKGNLPLGSDSVLIDGSILNPALVCAANFEEYLKRQNVHVALPAEVKFDTTHISHNLISVWMSPKYREIALYTNRVSSNSFAETILKSLVIAGGQKQITYKQAVDKLNFQLQALGLDVTKIKLVDGSGLSRQNLISPEFMCNFLQVMRKKYPGFENIIAVPGDKGTMTNFMSKYSSRSKVHLKSGGMTGVVNYAGYVKNAKGQTLCVTVMVNNVTCKISQVRPKLEKLIHLIALSD